MRIWSLSVPLLPIINGRNIQCPLRRNNPSTMSAVDDQSTSALISLFVPAYFLQAQPLAIHCNQFISTSCVSLSLACQAIQRAPHRSTSVLTSNMFSTHKHIFARINAICAATNTWPVVRDSHGGLTSAHWSMCNLQIRLSHRFSSILYLLSFDSIHPIVSHAQNTIRSLQR